MANACVTLEYIFIVMYMKKIIQIIKVFFIFAIFVSCRQNSEWEQLFNGKDLSGWTVECKPEDVDKKIWTVEDGAISCNSIDKGEHGHVWLVNEREFKDFELHLKFKAFADSPGNSGLQFRSRYDSNLQGGWMNGPQVDINPPEPMPWRTGLIYDETYREKRWIYPNLPGWEMPEEYKPDKFIMKYSEDGDGWNELILICKGMQVKTIVNGIVRIDWDATGTLDNENHKKHNVGESGRFAFQLPSGNKLKIKYKDIRVKELK